MEGRFAGAGILISNAFAIALASGGRAQERSRRECLSLKGFPIRSGRYGSPDPEWGDPPQEGVKVDPNSWRQKGDITGEAEIG